MQADQQLPNIDETALAMAYGAAIMEELHPGFLDRWVELAESDSLHMEIRRLREPPPSAALTEVLRRTNVLVRHIRFVALAHISTERRKRKKHAA
ncbi:MAG: hypothetical protein JWQ97_3543 [Phenylobacterium sp.]|nr:hypothetical protein [Phenylobacterium sp.]